MSEPIRDTETAVRELGALPLPVGTTSLTAEQRATIAQLIGDAKPATAGLLEHLAESVRDRREHEHPTWEDLFCLNLVSWAGERMVPVLRRLLDAEARVAELETLTAQATEFRLWEPGYGLYVRRAPGTQGFAVMEARRSDKGRRVWTTSGWKYSALLSDKELFCWPDAVTAVAEARRVMPGATVQEEPAEEHCDHPNGYGPYGCAGCGAFRPADDEDDVTPQVRKLRGILAGQREQAGGAS